MRYPYRVYFSENEGHTFWAAEIPSLKGCVAQGDTPEDALRDLEAAEYDWLDAAEKYGIEIPPIPIEKPIICSGKFTVRISPSVHEEAIRLAQQQKISLNQYVNDAIVKRNAELNNTHKAIQEAKSSPKMSLKGLLETFSGNGRESFFNTQRSDLVYSFVHQEG